MSLNLPISFRRYLENRSTNIKVKRIRETQWYPPDKIIELQKTSLFKTVTHAVRNVPYYRKVANETHFSFSRDTILSDITRFPILTKDIIRKNFSDLIDPRYLFNSIKNSSGGTTGEPTTIEQSNLSLEYAGIITQLQYESVGYKRGEMLIQIWGDERELFKYKAQGDGIVKVNDCHYILNSFKMSNIDMFRYVKFINENRPSLIVAYVQSIYAICRFLRENDLKIHTPTAVVTSAGTLYSDFRQVIEETFQCPVYNRYGSREMHNMAFECCMHNGLHVDTYLHYLEILDSQLRPIKKDGERGEIFVTLFHNPVMPLIRYKIGDIATYSEHLCQCGRGQPLIGNILGRNVDIFKNAKGDMIDGEYFTHLFYFSKNILQFQVVQNRVEDILINYTTKDIDNFSKTADELKQIKQKIRLVMGSRCKVSFHKCNVIPPSKSGKFRYTISNI